MSSMQRLCEAYAAHAGIAKCPDELRSEVARRLGLWPFWARAAAETAAFAVRYVLPTFLAGRCVRFEDLDDTERERVLTAVHNTSFAPLRAGFMFVKAIVLGSCYGPGDAA